MSVFTSWGGFIDRYPALKKGLKQAVSYYKLEKSSLSSCAKNRQTEQRKKVNGGVAERFTKTSTHSNTLNSLTRKPVAEKVSSAIEVWNTSEAVAKGLFPGGNPSYNAAHNNNPVLNAVKQKVSVEVWLNTKVLTPALAKFGLGLDLATAQKSDIEQVIVSLNTVANAANIDLIPEDKKNGLKISAHKEAIARLKGLIQAQRLEVNTESLTGENLEEAIQSLKDAILNKTRSSSEVVREGIDKAFGKIDGDITKHVNEGLEQYKVQAKALAKAFDVRFPLIDINPEPFSWTDVAKALHGQIAGDHTPAEKEALSELSATILREQRKCEHAQQQLVAELACHVHSQPAGLDGNNNEETTSAKAIHLLNSLSPEPENHEETDVHMIPSHHAPFSGNIFTFKCGLALTPNGMDALLCLEGKQHWSAKDKETYRNLLEVSDYLKTALAENHSSGIKGAKSPKGLGLEDLLKEAAKHAVHYSIGAPNDDPLRLAFQALVHSVGQLTKAEDPVRNIPAGPLLNEPSFSEIKTLGERLLVSNGARSACKGGYVAWCNGFQSSGKGTEFNAALQRLAKFPTYYKRTTSHGARTAWNLSRDLVRQVRKMLLGQKKDPLLGAVSTGDMGSGFNLRVQEQHEAFKALLKGGEVNVPAGYKGHEDYTHTEDGSVLETLKAQLGTLNGDPKAQARLKILDLWKKEGARSFRVHVGGEITKETLKNAFGSNGFFHFRGPKVRLRTLEKWAVEAYKLDGGEWKDPLRMPYKELKKAADSGSLGFKFLAQVNLLRRVANGGRLQGKDCGNLFQFSDLKNILWGRKPRETADEKMVRCQDPLGYKPF